MAQNILDSCGRPVEQRLNADGTTSIIYLGKDAPGAEIFRENGTDCILWSGERRYWRSPAESKKIVGTIADYDSLALVVIKPDAIRRQLDLKIIERLTASGLKIQCEKKFCFTIDLIYRFYRNFFASAWERQLIEYLTSCPSFGLLLRGEAANEKISRCKMDLRREFPPDPSINPALVNLLHTSDSPADCQREASLIFSQGELTECLGGRGH